MFYVASVAILPSTFWPHNHQPFSPFFFFKILEIIWMLLHRFALGVMIIFVTLSVILDISKNLKEKAGPLIETFRSMAPASGARWRNLWKIAFKPFHCPSFRNLETLAPIAELANKAFSAFEKYQQLQTVSGKDDLSFSARSNEVKPQAEEKKRIPASLANVLMKFMKFKNGIEKKNALWFLTLIMSVKYIQKFIL